jgi:filamentous hemagglutinin
MKKFVSILTAIIFISSQAFSQPLGFSLFNLTGGKVNINVGEKTTITGAVVAAGSYDEKGTFTDNDQLTLKTQELEYKDLEDRNTSKSTGFGLSTSVGVSKECLTQICH